MARKRNYEDEITSRQKRLLKRTKRWDQVHKRMHPIIQSYHAINESKYDSKIKSEIFRYIPIGSIACLEGWFRIAVADLINKKSECRKNAEKLIDIKFEVRDILAVQGKSLSGGDLVAHLISINTLSDVNHNLTTIIGLDFSELFKDVRINPTTAPNPVTFRSDAKEIFMDVSKTFELRHIFCHELATSKRVSVQQLENCAYSVLMYLIGAERVVQDFLEKEY